MRILRASVPAAYAYQPLRRFLRGEMQLSYSLLKHLKWCEGAIRVNGVPVHVNVLLREGDLVSVRLEERAPSPAVLPGAPALHVVYEDEDLLVIDKPAGLAMHPHGGGEGADSLAAALVAYLGGGCTPHFVSRLDKGTSGLLIAAKTGYLHDRLRRALHSEALHREYRAFALGSVTPERGVIDLPIAHADDSVVRRCIREGGLPSRTEYEVLACGGGLSFLRLVPCTGRTHQLRVHMAAVGHPLAGDWLYGTEDPALIARPALHSYALRFVHPLSGAALSFTAPLPPDLETLYRRTQGILR